MLAPMCCWCVVMRADSATWDAQCAFVLVNWIDEPLNSIGFKAFQPRAALIPALDEGLQLRHPELTQQAASPNDVSVTSRSRMAI